MEIKYRQLQQNTRYFYNSWQNTKLTKKDAFFFQGIFIVLVKTLKKAYFAPLSAASL